VFDRLSRKQEASVDTAISADMANRLSGRWELVSVEVIGESGTQTPFGVNRPGFSGGSRP
jgi:hypothetical protein